MEVILSKDVDRVGRAGQVLKVKDGYARNFLFPNNLAVPMTSANMQRLEQEKKAKAVQAEKDRKEAEALGDKLAALSLTIPVLVQEDETFFGSIAAHDISRALQEEGFEIDKNLIILEEPIKKLGIYEVPVKVHPEVIAKVKIWIVKK